MNNSQKKELALLTGIWTLAGLRSRKPVWSMLGAAIAGGLYYSSLQKTFDFAGKKVVITGGSRGLGLSLAWNLLNKGATVALLARDQEELDDAKLKLLTDFPTAQVFTHVCDVTEKLQLNTAIVESLRMMNGIDLLVNNAGSILVGPFASMTREDFEAQMKLHLYAVVESTQQILPYFKTRGGGRILNICSLGGKIAVPHMLPYDASKFALAGFSQGVSAELKQFGITVTTAYPTVMRTGSPIQAVFKGDHEREFAWFEAIDNMPGLSMSADEAAKNILEAVALGKSEIILSLPAKARLLAGFFFPETVQSVMSLVARFMPKKNSWTRKTGADSSMIMEGSFMLRPLHQKAQKDQQTYNQQPRHDAEFNLGVSKSE